MKLHGTSVIKFSDFIENLRDIAGTCFLTRNEFDYNCNKVCSYSHINKNFNLSWNACLEQAGLNIKKKVSFPITQGRKSKDKILLTVVICLCCLKKFESIDPKINRICKKCKNLKNQEDDWSW